MKRWYILGSLVLSFLLFVSPLMSQPGISILVNGARNGSIIAQGDTLIWKITLPVGAIAQNELWLDLNGNAKAEKGIDKLIFLFEQQDGMNMPGNDGPQDMDNMANGIIMTLMHNGLAPQRWVFVTKNGMNYDTATFSILPLPSPAFTISGTVLGPVGVDLSNIIVEAKSANDTIKDSPFWHALTSPSGAFSIGLKSGAPKLNPWRVGLGGGLPPGVVQTSRETLVVVTGNISGITFKVVKAAFITGTVTDGTNPLGDANVHADPVSSTGEWIGGGGMDTRTDPQGNYSLPVMPGYYKIFFQKDGFVPRFWNQKFLWNNANLVQVNAVGDTVKAINATLTAGKLITGRVTLNGMPLKDVTISAYSAISPYSELYQYWTGEMGFYQLWVPPGSYYIGFQWNGQHIYFNQKTSLPADLIPVTPLDSVIFDINADFNKFVEPSKFVTGVVNNGISPLPDTEVMFIPLFNDSLHFPTKATTDMSGHYIVNVNYGAYRVRFDHFGYIENYWNQKTTFMDADTLFIGDFSPDTIYGIGAKLTSGKAIVGRVTLDGNGVGATIIAYDTAAPYNPLYQGFAGEDGYYRLVVTPGIYYISFHSGQYYIFFNQKLMLPADPVKVLPTDTVVAGINGQLSSRPVLPGFKILAVKDVPNDQGKQIYLAWSGVQDVSMWGRVVKYSVWRRENKAATFLVEVPARDDMIYAVVVPTLFDSTKLGIPWAKFEVTAHFQGDRWYFTTPVDSGYSVDNLAPSVPGGFAGTVNGSTFVFRWHPVIDEDLQHYAVYRSTTPNFTPSATTLYKMTIDTMFVDAAVTAGVTYYYRISAFDFSGNESKFTQQLGANTQTGILGVSDRDAVPQEFALHQNYPNPFNPTTTISYGLPENVYVTLRVYNLLGQHVATLVDGKQSAGFYEIPFNASQLSSGIYLYHLSAGNYTTVRKMNLLK